MITHLTPYLAFNDQCEEALNFYAKALGGKIKMMSRVSDGPKEYHQPEHLNKIMHSELEIGKVSFMASDSMGRKLRPGTNTSLSLNFENVDEITSAWKNMCEGATITMELQETFWGAKFGTLQDKYGINWMFNCDKK
jgi:PhnB protein